MNVDLKCFSTLANMDTCRIDVRRTYKISNGHTVEDIVRDAGIIRENVRIAFVNGRLAEFDTILSEGDRIALAPAVGGM